MYFQGLMEGYLVFFVVLYLCLNLAIGWWASRKVQSTKDFVLAGRSLPFGLASMVTFATWFGSETLLGAPKEYVEHGLLAVIEEPFGAALCLILVGLVYAKKLYPLSVLTFSDLFGQVFGPNTERLSALVMIPSFFGWIAAQLVALGLTLHLLLPLDLNQGMTLGTALVMSYTLMGGMWSISITDFLHNLLLILGLVVLCWVFWDQEPKAKELFQDLDPSYLQFFPKDWNFSSGLQYLGAWITLGLGAIPGQDIFQRVMSAKSAKIARNSSIFAGFLYLTVAILPLLLGLMAMRFHPELLEDKALLIPNLVLNYCPSWMQALFLGALLSALLSTSSGAILAPASVLGENLLKPLLGLKEDRQVLLAIRLSVILVSLACLGLALAQQNIFELVSAASAFSLVSLFIPLNVALWWPKCSAPSVQSSMILGLGVWAASAYAYSGPIPIVWFGLLASAGGLLLGQMWVGITSRLG